MRNAFKGFVVLVGLVFTGCAGGQKAELMDAGKLVLDGISSAEAGEYQAAIERFDMALAESRPDERRAGHVDLHIAHVVFLKQDYRRALRLYQDYLIKHPEAPEYERRRVAREVERIAERVDLGLSPVGESLADRHLRGHVKLVEANEALAEDRFADASRHLDLAFQYLGDPNILLEAALAATAGEQWQRAAILLRAYVGLAAPDLDERARERLAREIAVVDDLHSGVETDAVPTLAACVYETRQSAAFAADAFAVGFTAPAESCL